MKFQIACTLALSLLLLATAGASGQEPAVGNAKAPASSDKTLVTTARLPEDHLGLAKYFQELASQEQALAKSYERIAKIYKEKVLPAGLDPALAREMKDQYKKLAEIERKAGEAAANVAAYHARLADLVGHLTVEAKPPNPQDAAFRR